MNQNTEIENISLEDSRDTISFKNQLLVMLWRNFLLMVNNMIIAEETLENYNRQNNWCSIFVYASAILPSAS